MPMYEYRCLSCGVEFEKLQHFSDPPLTTCEACGGPVKKLISQTSFILKGSGWYVTDYARKNSNGSNGSPKKTASSSEPTTPASSAKETKKESGEPKKATTEAA